MSKVNPEPNIIHIMGCYVLGNPNGEKVRAAQGTSLGMSAEWHQGQGGSSQAVKAAPPCAAMWEHCQPGQGVDGAFPRGQGGMASDKQGKE